MGGKWLIVAGIVLAAGASVAVSAPQLRVQRILATAGYDTCDVGVLVKESGVDSALVAINADRPYIAASVTKLATGAAALELLGLTYRFATTIYHDGRFDRAKGAVEGNLYVRGGGDPGFTAERLWLFVQHLTHIGLKKIEGDLVLDDSFFDSVTTGPGYDEDRSSRAYEAPVAALSANFNTIAVHVAPGGRVGAPVHITDFPKVDGISIVSTATTVDARGGGRLRVQTREQGGTTAIVASGSMGLNDEPRYIYRRAWRTWEFFGRTLTALFRECGIQFTGAIKHRPVPDSLIAGGPLYTFESEPIVRFVENMFKYSSNFAAEMVFKTIAAERDTFPGSWAGGVGVLRRWWHERELPDTLAIVNGSGMGKANRLSARQVTALLAYVRDRTPYAADFTSALSVAGYDGTLESRFTTSPLRGLVRAKTGTLNDHGASCLAGYVPLPGKCYVFAILINSPKITQFSHWVTQRKILEAVAMATE